MARYGGEEFAVILPNTDEAGAKAQAERYRNGLLTVDWPLRQVTASFGVAELAPDTDAEAIICKADKAMYASKHSGRNRVTTATELARPREREYCLVGA